MTQYAQFLKDFLGIAATCEPWESASHLPLAFAKAADYYTCNALGTEFIVADVPSGASLPELKRLFKQVSRRVDLPVVLACKSIDSRQRKVLIAQGIPFIVPDFHVSLPFLGFAASKGRSTSIMLRHVLTTRAQAALVALLSSPSIDTAKALRERTGMTASEISKALEELEGHQLVKKERNGRTLMIALTDDRSNLLARARDMMQDPVRKTLFVRRSEVVDGLPDAGETALAKRSMLVEPRTAQKAVSRKTVRDLDLEEVVEGELPNDAVVEVQVWAYDPLVAGLGRIDDVSLALSLYEEGDERVNGELNRLFDEEELWS